MNGRAVSVAPGVYEVDLTSGERIRVAFGEEGRRYDQVRLQEELRVAQASPQTAAQKRKIQVLNRALRGLAQESGMQKTAVTGSTCNFPFTLDGGYTPKLVGGDTWGQASIGKDVGFSPPPPSYPGRSAYTYVATKAFPDQAEAYWDDDGPYYIWGVLGTVRTSAVVNCGSAVWDCYSWESFSYVREYGCTAGYRSINRTN